MKSYCKWAAMTGLILIAGCGEQDNRAKAAVPGMLETQREALNNAKQVERTLQDAEAQQRKTIEESTGDQGQ